jgi:hypothetical protein
VGDHTELNNPRVLEKLEIERRYWLSQGIDWKIVTENEISRQKAKNIEWLFTAEGYCLTGYCDAEIKQAKEYMQNLLNCGDHSIIEVTQYVENDFMLPPGAGLQLFKQLVIDRRYVLDLGKPLNLTAKAVAA